MDSAITIMSILSPIGKFIYDNVGGFFSSGVIAIVGFLIKYIYENRGIRSSQYTGWWEQCIYDIGDDDCKGDIIKTDYYQLKHSKHKYSGELVINITGTIRRKKPTTLTKPRVWNVSGYLSDEILTLLYRAHEGQKSRGCIYVKMKSNDDFQGFYLEEHEDGKIDKTPLILRKVRDIEKIKDLNKWNKEMKKDEKINKRSSRVR